MKTDKYLYKLLAASSEELAAQAPAAWRQLEQHTELQRHQRLSRWLNR